jgi:hypothetical protein
MYDHIRRAGVGMGPWVAEVDATVAANGQNVRKGLRGRERDYYLTLDSNIHLASPSSSKGSLSKLSTVTWRL